MKSNIVVLYHNKLYLLNYNNVIHIINFDFYTFMKSQDMIDKNYFDHNYPTYGSPFDMMRKFGVSYRAASENIAEGQIYPQEIMNDWMNSEGHRKNILNPNFTTLGVGVAKTSSGRLYWTQMFIG